MGFHTIHYIRFLYRGYLMQYTRRLTITESIRHYIHISKPRRSDFPPTHEKFTIITEDGDEFEVEIDKKNRMWVAVLQLKYKFSTGMVFKIESSDKKTYTISQIGTSDFPNFAMMPQTR